jgi:hypothetical protein
MGSAAVSHQTVVLFIEAQRVPHPPDSNVAPHLSLSHSESVGARKFLRPSSVFEAMLLYKRHLSRIFRDLRIDRCDQDRIPILGIDDALLAAPTGAIHWTGQRSLDRREL